MACVRPRNEGWRRRAIVCLWKSNSKLKWQTGKNKPSTERVHILQWDIKYLSPPSFGGVVHANYIPTFTTIPVFISSWAENVNCVTVATSLQKAAHSRQLTSFTTDHTWIAKLSTMKHDSNPKEANGQQWFLLVKFRSWIKTTLYTVMSYTHSCLVAATAWCANVFTFSRTT